MSINESKPNTNDIHEDSPAMDECTLQQITALPCWQGRIHATTLGGGITNRNYRIEDDSGVSVVRLGCDIPVHQILRFNELSASRAANAAGIAPAILYHEPGVLVLEYINSQPLSPADVRKADKLSGIVDLVSRCHHEVPLHLRGASLVFWVFHVVRDYAATLRESDSLYKSQLNDWLDLAQRLELEASPYDIVFGHNDLLAANILDDGERLWLIDWEYAGFNTPLFDLGGLASNNELLEDQEIRMLEQYFAEPLSKVRYRQYRAMKCASLLRETLWSMVSEVHSQLAFDYAEYSRENLQRFDAAMREFESA